MDVTMCTPSEDQRMYDEILHLRKPTVVSALVESVSKPRGYVPKRGGLPIWKTMRLDDKLTIPVAPKSELVFCRDKIGRKLWRNPKGKEFDLTDPYCHSIDYFYESLHDANLQPYFRRKANNDRVRELGLLTEDSEAICSLKDFNTYRRYLYTVHADSINRERSRQDASHEEGELLKKAEEFLEKDIQRQKASCDRVERMKKNMKDVEAAYQKRRKSWLDSMKSHEVRLQEIAEENRATAIRRMKKSQMKAERFRARIAHGDQIARQRRVQTVNKRIAGDKHRRKRLNREAEEMQKKKEADLWTYWEKKLGYQRDKMDQHKRLIEIYLETMEDNLKKRNKFVRRQWIAMDDLITSAKAERLRRGSEKNNLWTMEAMVKALTKAWEDERGFINEKIRERIVQVINMEVAECKNKPEGKEVLSLLQEAKRKLDHELDVPEPVTLVLETLLDKVIIDYVKKSVDGILKSVGEKTLNCTKELEAIMLHKDKMADAAQEAATRPAVGSEPNLRRRSFKMSTQTLRTTGTSKGEVVSKGTSDTKLARLVSFGGIETIDSTDITGKPVEQLLKSKTRLPTPVPSLTELVEAVFREPVFLERDATTAHNEKKKLDDKLLTFSKDLLKATLVKAEQSLRMRMAEGMFVKKRSKGDIDLDAITEIVSLQILYEEEPRLLENSKLKKLSDRFVQDLVLKKKRSGGK